MKVPEFIFSLIFGLTPTILLLGYEYLISLIIPLCAFLAFTKYIKKIIGGYTGDCCGAIFLITEICYILNYFIFQALTI